MKFGQLIELVANEPVFSSSLLLAGKQNSYAVRLQLSRWVSAGKIIKLKRGLYALAEPWRKTVPHPFLTSNRLWPGSYVSLQAALAWHGTIPEYVPVVTSVGCGRPNVITTPLGSFKHNFIHEKLRFGYDKIEVAPSQFAFVAVPEKALLDLVFLTPGADTQAYIEELRLQNHAAFHLDLLHDFAARSGKPKLQRAAAIIKTLFETDRIAYS